MVNSKSQGQKISHLRNPPPLATSATRGKKNVFEKKKIKTQSTTWAFSFDRADPLPAAWSSNHSLFYNFQKSIKIDISKSLAFRKSRFWLVPVMIYRLLPLVVLKGRSLVQGKLNAHVLTEGLSKRSLLPFLFGARARTDESLASHAARVASFVHCRTRGCEAIILRKYLYWGR